MQMIANQEKKFFRFISYYIKVKGIVILDEYLTKSKNLQLSRDFPFLVIMAVVCFQYLMGEQQPW